MPVTVEICPRLRTPEEIRTAIPKPVFFGLATSFWIGGCLAIAAEAYVIYEGLSKEYNYYLGQINGARLGLSSVFLITGFLCFLSILKPNRKVAILTLIAAIASTAISSVLVCGWEFSKLSHYSNDFFRGYLKQGKLFEETWSDELGRPKFPFMPWTPSFLVLATVPTFILCASIATLMSALNILVRVF